jgi:hypothetical protein
VLHERLEEIYKELYYEEGYLAFLKDHYPNETNYQLESKGRIRQLLDKLYDAEEVS